MIAYFCKNCKMYFRELELVKNKKCPECKEKASPRLILAGQVMGAETNNNNEEKNK